MAGTKKRNITNSLNLNDDLTLWLILNVLTGDLDATFTMYFKNKCQGLYEPYSLKPYQVEFWSFSVQLGFR
jgi:hypothetical protein